MSFFRDSGGTGKGEQLKVVLFGDPKQKNQRTVLSLIKSKKTDQ